MPCLVPMKLVLGEISAGPVAEVEDEAEDSEEEGGGKTEEVVEEDVDSREDSERADLTEFSANLTSRRRDTEGICRRMFEVAERRKEVEGDDGDGFEEDGELRLVSSASGIGR